ncbi:MAG: hypothetical protein AAB393_19710 [Bacteroidota bacterium]
MSDSNDDIRYRDVPAGIPKQLVDECWGFADTAHWTIEDLETAAKRVFNARLVDDPVDWERRLDEARSHLESVQTGLKQLRQRLGRIKKMAPKLRT